MAKKYAASNTSVGNPLDASSALPSQTKPDGSKQPKHKRRYKRKIENHEMSSKEEESDNNQNAMVIIYYIPCRF